MSRQRWFEFGGLDIKRRRRRKRRNEEKKRKKKGKLEKRRCGLQAKMGLTWLWLVRTAAPPNCSRVSDSYRHFSPSTWFPLYTFVFSISIFLFLKTPFPISSLLPSFELTYFPWISLPRISYSSGISRHLPLYYVTEIIAPASHLSV